MLKSYFLLALRQLAAQKLYAVINVAGLAVGIACCLLIALFVRHELSYDRQYRNADRIYRVSSDTFSVNGRPEAHSATAPPVLTSLLKETYPEIEQIGRMSKCGAAGGGAMITSDKLSFYEPGFTSADNEMFKIFDFEWLRGDPATALTKAYQAVITESAAQRYFGGVNEAFGNSLYLEVNTNPFQVVGVIRDLPSSTHLQFSVMVDFWFGAAPQGMLESWGLNCFHTYLLLRKGATIDAIRAGSAALYDKHLREGASRESGYTVTPIADIHLKSHRQGEMRPPGSAANVYAFAAVAGFILLIACVNFMNLATARAAQRAKEVGLRKSVGARRTQLVSQFLGESVLLACLATLCAVGLAFAAKPVFGRLIEQPLELGGIGVVLPLALVALAVVVGLAAGSYPAFYLAAFKPARVLKGDATRSRGAAQFRRALVVLQFAISIALVIATVVVFEQTRFARNIELGYDKEQIVVLTGAPTRGLGAQWQTMKQELLADPEIVAATASSSPPGNAYTNNIVVRPETGPEPRSLYYLPVDFDFFETFKIAPLAGRTLTDEHPADRLVIPQGQDRNARGSGGWVLNETAARELGWSPAEAIDQRLEVAGAALGPVVGVVPDIHFESVRDPIKPTIYIVWQDESRTGFKTIREASIRVTGRNLAATLAHIDTTWKQFSPEQPVTRRFLDEDFEKLYRAEERQAAMLTFFALLAIFVACLGVLGLASYTTARRTKEIGIRKTHGASVWHIVKLFAGEFGVLVLAANAIAWPVAYFAMQRWLQSFAYRIELGPLAFVGGGLAALAVAWLTVAAVAARAARAKPVGALRYE
jgi:putative ABC transport system permease protein